MDWRTGIRQPRSRPPRHRGLHRRLLQLPAHSFGGKQFASGAIRNFDLLKNPFVRVQRGLTTTVPPRTGATLIDHYEFKERPTPQRPWAKKQPISRQKNHLLNLECRRE